MTPAIASQWDQLLRHLPADYAPADRSLLRAAADSIKQFDAVDPETGTRGFVIAELLLPLSLDAEAVAAALLFPCVEAGIADAAQLEKNLAPGVSHLIRNVERLGVLKRLRPADNSAAQIEKLRDMLMVIAQDPRALVIRIGDQLARLRAAYRLSPEQQTSLGRDGLDLFAPLAGRLGIGQFKWELEDRAFRALEPDAYQEIARALDQQSSEREDHIRLVVAALQDQLAVSGIEAQVAGRAKHLYSIWKKMRDKGLAFNELMDLLAVRVLVEGVEDCYAVLGLVHSVWTPIAGEFDDYIAKPKPNRYQSLHTAVMGPGQRPVEIQIRTHAMHRHAELGYAAHWHYKEGGSAVGAQERIAWLRGFLDRQSDARADLIERFKEQAFHERIYVLTPQGRVVDLPAGATALDFAYVLHTELGHRCRGAKVDGTIAPLTEPLVSGQQVEILTTRQGGPSRDWLSTTQRYVTTETARKKIRRWFKQQEHDKYVAQGRDLFEREEKRAGVHDSQLAEVARHFELKNAEEFLAAVGSGRISPGQLEHYFRERRVPEAPRDVIHTVAEKAQRAAGDLYVLGVSNLLTRIAGCCKPVPNEPIAGYITQGQGVAIHRQDCPNLRRSTTLQPQRLIDVAWATQTASAYTTDLQIEAHDRRGLLRDVSDAIASEQVNIIAVNTLSDRTRQLARMTLTVEVMSHEQLERVLRRLNQMPDIAARRVR